MLEITGTACLALYIAYPASWSNLYTGILLWIVAIATCYETYHLEAAADKLMETFRAMVPNATIVIRDGKPFQIDPSDLVPGDVIKIKSGDKIPADCRVAVQSSCRVDQSMITGESEAVEVQTKPASENPLESKNLIFNGSVCVDGSCTAIVLRTGDETLIGKMVGLTGNAGTLASTLKADIAYFCLFVAVFSFAQACFIFIVGCAQGVSPLNVFVQGFVVVMVGNIPEGLPTTISTSLFIIAQRMTAKNVFVKKLDIIETLGSCTCICTDKTGTLTKNEMSVVNTWVVDMKMTAKEYLGLNVRESLSSPCTASQLSLLTQVAALNSRVTMQKLKGSEKLEPAGDATERGIYEFLGQAVRDRFRMDIEQFRSANPKLYEIPFNSANKWQMSIHSMRDPPGGGEGENQIMFLKGAPDVLIQKCASYVDHRLEHVPIDKHFLSLFQEANSYFGQRAERVLACAMRPMDQPLEDWKAQNPHYLHDLKKRLVNKPGEGEEIQPINDLIFVGFLCLMDPPRDEVPQAIVDCRAAGVKVVMVTGDHPETAAAIARNIGLISGQPCNLSELRSSIKAVQNFNSHTACQTVVIHGQDDIAGMDENDWKLLVSIPEVVFARTSPESKLIIVEKFTEAGNVTAMTGDGVNDSPALKRAQIGIAMGVNGSNVAREAADIVLLDDNFASIVVGIKEGRLLFANLKKSIAYTLAHLVPEALPVIVWAIIGCPQPMGSTLALCVDLMTDLFPAFSLAYEQPEGNIMSLPPRNTKTDKLTPTPLLLYSYGVAGMILTGGCYYTYFMTFNHFGVTAKDLFSNHNTYFPAATPSTVFHTSDGSGRAYDANMQQKILYIVQGAWFLQIVAGQATHLMTTRTSTMSIFLHGVFLNKHSNLAILISVGLGLFVTYTPGIQSIVQSANPFSQHIAAATTMVFFCFWTLSEGRKYFSRSHPTHWLNKRLLEF